MIDNRKVGIEARDNICHNLNKIIDTSFINWSKVFINLGLFAQMIAFINFVPQIVKNFILKKAESLSIWFLLMAVLAIIFDEVSALALLVIVFIDIYFYF